MAGTPYGALMAVGNALAGLLNGDGNGQNCVQFSVGAGCRSCTGSTFVPLPSPDGCLYVAGPDCASSSSSSNSSISSSSSSSGSSVSGSSSSDSPSSSSTSGESSSGAGSSGSSGSSSSGSDRPRFDFYTYDPYCPKSYTTGEPNYWGTYFDSDNFVYDHPLPTSEVYYTKVEAKFRIPSPGHGQVANVNVGSSDSVQTYTVVFDPPYGPYQQNTSFGHEYFFAIVDPPDRPVTITFELISWIYSGYYIPE